MYRRTDAAFSERFGEDLPVKRVSGVEVGRYRRKAAAAAIALAMVAGALVVSLDSTPATGYERDWTLRSAFCPEGSIRPGIQTYVVIWTPPMTGPPPPSQGPYDPRIEYYPTRGLGNSIDGGPFSFVQKLSITGGRQTIDVNHFLTGPQDPNQPGQPDTNMMRMFDDVDVAIRISTGDLFFSVACITYVNRGGLGSAGSVSGTNLQLPPVIEQVIPAGGVP